MSKTVVEVVNTSLRREGKRNLLTLIIRTKEHGEYKINESFDLNGEFTNACKLLKGQKGPFVLLSTWRPSKYSVKWISGVEPVGG